VNLDPYFRRIGWESPIPSVPNLATLQALLTAHMAKIPWENFDVLLGRTIRLDLESLEAKLVTGQRGGYCYEHASLLFAVLESMGFRSLRHSARVTMIDPRTVAPRTHMFLTVTVPEGRFVLDPGFGGLAPTVPVPLVSGTAVRSGSHMISMVRDGDVWILRVVSREKTIDGWATTLEVDNPSDFVMANHYTSTYESSEFVNRLMLRGSRGENGRSGRVTVMNRDVTLTSESGASETYVLSDRTSLRALVREHLRFDLPEIETLRVPTIPEWG
jgi:N-hydroxyarylamine O-acetyltransferase